jgi:hypothetical protein
MNTISPIITIENQQEFFSLLPQWFESYLQKGEMSDQEWLAKELSKTIPETAQETASAIAGMAESIKTAKASLVKARSRGMSREEWFSRELGKADQYLGENTLWDLALGLENTFLQELPSVFSDAAQKSTTTEPDTKWTEYSIKEKIFDAEKTFELLAMYGLSVVESWKEGEWKNLPGISEEKQKQIANLVLNKDSSSAITVVAGALTDAAEKKILSIFHDEEKVIYGPYGRWMDLSTMTATAGRVVETMKIAHDLASGATTLEDAANDYIDMAVGTGAAIIKETCKKYGGIAGEATGKFVGHYVGKIFGPAGAEICGKVGKRIGEFLGEKIGAVITTGVEKIGRCAKKIASCAADTAKSIARGVGNVAKSIANGVRSLFSW